MNVTRPPRLAQWWTDDPGNPGCASVNNLYVQRLLSEIDGGCRVTDLGGTMSLNLLIEPAGLVLRVHQPFVSRRRLHALQAVRMNLARQGLAVPVPVDRRGSTVLRCGDRWAELETYIPHEQPAPTAASYVWMFGAMGRLHRALAPLDPKVPRPVVATYASPGSLRRWLRVTEATVLRDSEAWDIVQLTGNLSKRLQRRWVCGRLLPRQLVHGDVRLGNVCRSPEGETVYLDFGFMAIRPRIHDLGYALAFMVRALHGYSEPSRFNWRIVPELLEEYDSAAGRVLSGLEREALAAYTAAVPLYFTALAGLTNDPVRQLREHLPFLHLSEWLLQHPEVVRG